MGGGKKQPDSSAMAIMLWRHAEAEDGMPDNERALTPRGIKQAKCVARWLEPRLPKDTRIIVSPATRAQQTAAALTRKFEIVERIGTGANAKDILAAAGWPHAGGTVLIVGHQPTLGRVAAHLLAGKQADWQIKKGALWWFASRAGDGGPETLLRAVTGPDLVET